MARSKRLLPIPYQPGDRLTRGYGRLARQLEFWSNGTLTKRESQEYAHAIQAITAIHQRGAMSNDQFAEYFYEIYQELLDDYGVDMHDKEFYPKSN